jgi:hypothetical protein
MEGSPESLDRTLALLSSADVQERLRSAQQIERELATGVAKIADLSALLRALLKRLMDGREACRISAANSIGHLSSRLSPDCLPLLIPVVKYRIETDPSEFQRRLLLQILRKFITKFAEIAAFYTNDFLVIFLSGILDRDPDVICEACAGLTYLSTMFPGKFSHSQSIEIIVAAMKILKHRHARLRIAALETISAYMYFGAGETIRTLAAFREANVVPIASFYGPEIRTNYFALLVEDGNAKVRQKFYSMLQKWSINLPERTDYETLLAPYLFSGFFDEDAEIRKTTIETIEKCGRVYMQDHEEQFYDELRFRPRLELWKNAQPLILPPLNSRPNQGARLIVRSQIPRLLPPLLLEISDWKETTRESSLSLVRMLLLYAEEKAATNSIEILSALVSGDDDLQLSQTALDCARLIGHNVDITVWLPFFTEIGDGSRKRFLPIALACFGAARAETIRDHREKLECFDGPIGEFLWKIF